MGLETQFKSAPTFNANLMELPILQQFSQNEIATKVNTFSKAEKNIGWFLKLGVYGVAGWAAWKYILTPIAIAVGQFAQLAITGILCVGLVVATPAIFAWLQNIARKIHRTAIRYAPFEELARTRAKMIANQSTFRIAKANLAMLKGDMEIEAKKSQDDAEKGQREILRLRAKAEKIKADMEAMVTAGGVEARGEDAYVDLASELQKTLATATQVAQKTEQSKDFTQKYGTRANILKKVNQKLVMVETGMDIKISAFDTTVEMLKKDFNFGQKLNSATTAAKSALGLDKDWKRDYAFEVINTTIANDIAISSGNFKDIESLTSNYDLNSDELFDNLNLIADKIQTGNDLVPQAKTYANPEYKLTSNDKVKAGGFTELF